MASVDFWKKLLVKSALISLVAIGTTGCDIPGLESDYESDSYGSSSGSYTGSGTSSPYCSYNTTTSDPQVDSFCVQAASYKCQASSPSLTATQQAQALSYAKQTCSILISAYGNKCGSPNPCL